MRLQFTILLSLIMGLALNAQIDSRQTLADFDAARLNLNKQGMQILGAWALLNIGWSASQLGQSNSIKQSYHQMNIGWNAVNLAIAGFGYYQSIQGLEWLSISESLQEQYAIEKILAVNAALDLAYVAGGLYLKEYARRQDNPGRFDGFGRAVMVNGAFLLTFDIIMYWVHKHHFNQDLLPVLDNLRLGPQQVGLQINF